MTLPPEREPDGVGTSQGGTRPGRRITLSVLSGAGNTVLISGLGALSIRLITVHVGPTNYGLLVVALTFVTSVMLLTDLGINAITGREIAKSPNDAAEILGHNLGLRLTLSVALIPILAAVGIAVYQRPTLRWSIILIAIAIPFDALRSISIGYYVASIRNYISSAIGLLQQVIYVSGVAFALACGFGIVGCAASFLFSTIVSGITAFVMVRREVVFKPLFNMKRWREVFKQSVNLGVIQVINVLYLKADTLILSRLVTPHAVGLYGVAYSFITFFLVVPSLLMKSVMPLLATASDNEFAELVRRSARGLAVIGTGVALFSLLFAPQAIMVLAGSRYLGAATSMRLLSLACLFSYLNVALGWAAVARNGHHRIVIVSAIGLVLNVGLNLVMIPRFGINGAATATLVTEVITLVGTRIIFQRDVGVKISLAKLSLRSLLTGIAVVLFGRYVLLHSWHASTATILWFPGIFFLYLLLLALAGGLNEEVALASEKLKGLVKQRGKGL